jgi:hypothetical protein
MPKQTWFAENYKLSLCINFLPLIIVILIIKKLKEYTIKDNICSILIILNDEVYYIYKRMQSSK